MNSKIKELTKLIIDKYPKFLSDPASSKYHGCYFGGLFDHSLMVYKTALRCDMIYGITPLDGVNFIACMFHDLCKVGQYKVINSHIFDNNLSKFEFAHNDGYSGIEHGAESLRRLLLIPGMNETVLPESWQFAIAYHMGVFGVSNTEMKNFSKMSEKYPEVLLLHHADMIATKIAKC